MAIQIIDNFQVNVANAIDNRLVVGPSQFYTDKDDLPYKYAGMRVWDLNDGVSGVPYVWNGTTFETEASSGIAGSGTPGFIPKFITAAGNVLDDSIIQIGGNNVGIGISPIKTLHVNGDIQSDGSGGFYGRGTFITQLNASNITSGTLALGYLPNGSSGQVLKAGSPNPTWVDQSSLSVGYSGVAGNVYHQQQAAGGITTALPLLSGSGGGSGNTPVYYSDNLSIVPDFTGGGAPESSLYLNGFMGIDVAPDKTTNSVGIRLKVNGSMKTTSIGINNSPSTSYKLYVNGTTYLGGTTTANTINAGSITGYSLRLNSNITLSAPSTNYLKIKSSTTISGIWMENSTQTSSLYIDSSRNLITGGNSPNNDGFANFKLSPTGLKLPQALTLENGVVPSMTIAFSVPHANNTSVYTHNLGYIPIVVLQCQDGNVHPNITLITTTQVKVYNYNTGSNTATGTLYLY